LSHFPHTLNIGLKAIADILTHILDLSFDSYSVTKLSIDSYFHNLNPNIDTASNITPTIIKPLHDISVPHANKPVPITTTAVISIVTAR
jgi:hypothetical protein